jgi:hypothetical protein
MGWLCPEHGQRLANHYGAREGIGERGRESHGLPWMWEHMRLAYPSLAGWSGGTLASGDIDDAEAEKLAAVITLRQDIHDHLSAVVADLAERLGRKGPDLATTQRLAVQRAARWLLAHIEPLRAAQGIGDAADEAVATLVEEADALASRAHALAPWREAPTRVKWAPCRCGSTGTVHDFGDVRRCGRCQTNYSEEEWRALTVAFGARFGRPGGSDTAMGGHIDLHHDEDHAVIHAVIPTDVDGGEFLDTYPAYLARHYPDVVLVVHEYMPHRFSQEGQSA